MPTYKKRGQAGYTGRKEAKTKIGRERNFGKDEIKQALEEYEQGEDYRYHYHGNKKLNELQKAEKEVRWYEKVLGYWTRDNVLNQTRGDSWFGGIVCRYKSSLKKAKEKRDELAKKEKEKEA